MAQGLRPLLLALILAFLQRGVAVKARASTTLVANPIRKVVNMLQAMERRVREQGEKEQELFDKFMCYCKNGLGSLEKSISDAETKIPALRADMESTNEQVDEMKETLKQEQAEKESAKQAVAEATSLREKEQADYTSQKDEYNANIEALKNAIASIDKGSSLIQQDASVLRRAVRKQRELLEEDREAVLSFLGGSQSQEASPATAQIIGILKQMHESMTKNLQEITAAEKEAVQTYEALMTAKRKEIDALTASIESKVTKVGELNVALVEMKADLEDTEQSLAEDQAFLKELETSCQTKESEWTERQKTRSAEQLAISETIKTLNDDEALDLFKSTLPTQGSNSLMQIQVSTKELAQRARSAVQRARANASHRSRAKIDLIALALVGKKAELTKVLKLIDDMIDMLKKEQDSDDKKKDYCEKEFDASEDKKKATENTLDDAKHDADGCQAGIQTLKEEIGALMEGISTLDKEVADVTQQRKEENSEFQSVLASNTAAKELLLIAKNRLNKFYNPKQYNPAARKELGAVSAVAREFDAAEFVQVSAEVQADPGPPPDTFGDYKKSEASAGVLQMIDTLVKTLDTDLAEAKTEEKNAQTEYELFIADSKEKRQADAKSVADKEESKANLESDLEGYKAAVLSATKELEANAKYVSSLHSQCDFLMNFYEVRTKARSGEIGSLQDAKAVLSGADA
jgi:chromosome segregation ATPase